MKDPNRENTEVIELKKQRATSLIKNLVESQTPGQDAVKELQASTGNPNMDENDVRAYFIENLSKNEGLSLDEIQKIITNTQGSHQADMQEALKRVQKNITLRGQGGRNGR